MITIALSGGDSLTQWDSGRRIIITGLESVTDAEVHFASAADNHAYVILPYTESSTVYANIPNILLTQYYTIRVYVYQSNRTISSVDFPIAVRPKPDDYVYTPTETLNYHTLNTRIDGMQEKLTAGNNITINGNFISAESGGTDVSMTDNPLGGVDITVDGNTKTLANRQDISGKQDTIADLAAIRSGAALGATALQTHQDISGKQDTIADLATIRAGASLGATALQAHQDISGKQDTIADLAAIRSNASTGATAAQSVTNDYFFTLPPKIYTRNGATINLYWRNVVTENYHVKYGMYTGKTTIRNTDDCSRIIASDTGYVDIKYRVYDNHLNELENSTNRLVISDTPPNSQTMLMIGDSFIYANKIEPALRNLFTADGKTLTLIGTQGSGSNKHEGYSGKKYTQFADGFSGSPFGENGFGFAGYMQNQGYSGVDSVYIQLGTNDASAGDVLPDMSASVTASQTIVNSILSYNANIMIYLGLCVMPNLNSVKFSETYNGIGFNWVMKANMQKLNKMIINAHKNNPNVRIVATNMILDNTVDIDNNVHPTTAGYAKMANQIYYTMMGGQ